MTTLSAQKTSGLSPRRLYVALAIAEAITWTALIIGLILKAVQGIEPTLLTIIGGVHGFVFISYGATAILVAINQRWHFGIALLAVVAALLPYATIPLEIVQAKRGALEGPWRLEATDDPRDNHWFDRFVRWFLNRPALLVIAILLAIIAIFASLMLAGPPGGR
jgi:integral membrane protein